MSKVSSRRLVLRINYLVYYGLFIIAIVLVVVKLVNPLLLLWLSWSLLVVFWFTIYMFLVSLEGILLRQYLLSKLSVIKHELQKKIEEEIENKVNTSSDTQNYYIEKDRINRLAFIEKVCSESENFVTWEEDRRYYQLLPNLLLALGLLGTFIGITINLILLAINISSDVALAKAIGGIIDAMAIAFVSSLTALLFSFLLTIFHPSSVLDMKRDKLFIFLEDYLDNEYFFNKNQPSLQEKIDDLSTNINTYTRILQEKIDNLSTNIDTYTTSLNSFVEILPQSTTSFESAVSGASEMLTTSANNFNQIAKQCSEVIQNKTNALNETNTGLRTLLKDLEELTTGLTGFITISLKITGSLDSSKESFDKTIKALDTYTDKILQVDTALVNNSTSIKILIKQNGDTLNTIYENFKDISSNIEQSANNILVNNTSFTDNTSRTTKSLKKYTTKVDKQLQSVADQIASSAEIMEQIQIQLCALLTSLTPPSPNP